MKVCELYTRSKRAFVPVLSSFDKKRLIIALHEDYVCRKMHLYSLDTYRKILAVIIERFFFLEKIVDENILAIEK